VPESLYFTSVSATLRNQRCFFIIKIRIEGQKTMAFKGLIRPFWSSNPAIRKIA
jgi:hypothetical protein